DDEDVQQPEAEGRLLLLGLMRLSRSTRKHVSYREQTSDSDRREFTDSASDDDFEAPSLRPQRHCAPHSAPITAPSRTKHTKKRKASGSAQKRLDASIKRRRLSEVDTDSGKHGDTLIQFTGKTMPWPTLPYHILLAVFDYASRPLVDDIFQPTASIKWLYNVAFCCKAFLEPALSVLYYSPPLHPPSRAHRLLSHLATDMDSATFNYGAKVKYLDIEASSTLLHKFDGWDPLDLGALVSHTPQLRGVAIHLRSDGLAWRKSGRSRSVAGSRAAYHSSVITALQENKVMLHDWTWNDSLAKQSQSAFPLTQMRDVHMTAPFQTLRSLTLVNYPAGPIEKGRLHEDMLAEAINTLPKLTELHFYMSSVNKRFLSKFPDGLKALEIVECPVLKSSALDRFLAAKGGNMRQLVLDHNQSLNLAFLTDLARNCPQLELLKADLRYFGTLILTRDTDPKYDALLNDGQRPTWPETLQSLELFHLRKWNLETAELFFSSLTDSAEMLPHLRQLKIKASLDESGWRERIAFRDNWTDKLQRVFRRKPLIPNPHLKSLSAFEHFKTLQKGFKTTSGVEKRQTFTRAKASHLSNGAMIKANRVAVAPQPTLKDTSEGDSDAPLIKRTSSVTHDADLYVQGLCDVVDVLIDNLRPTEEQLREDDFLDDEVSGDEDWNGDDDILVDSGYAW
ncbi:hypothetical protein BDR22DRAFT_810263, partial [Usnea florida]